VEATVNISFQHYAFLSIKHHFLGVIREPKATGLDKLFNDVADVIFYGHAHKASDIQGGNVT